MHTDTLIQPHHAIRASRFLLALDISALHHLDKPKIRDEVRTLIQVITNTSPFFTSYPQKNQPVYRDLRTLAHLVNHLAKNALTEEARACLTHFIHQH